jgi:Predicted integral membrane protein
VSNIEKSIEVEVPVQTAYNQWTQFEEFPRFMEGIQQVTQLDDKRLRWRANVGGQEKEWEAEITEQRPDERIAWRSRDGAANAGVVTFHRIADARTRVMLQLEYEPEGVIENVGDAIGVVSRRVAGDLERFNLETRGRETGACRGESRLPGRCHDIGPSKPIID